MHSPPCWKTVTFAVPLAVISTFVRLVMSMQTKAFLQPLQPALYHPAPILAPRRTPKTGLCLPISPARNCVRSSKACMNITACSSTNLTFTIPYDRQGLADYLNADRSALSSELSKLQKEGVLSYKKNTFSLRV